MPPILHPLTIHPRRRPRIINPRAHLIPPLHIHILYVERVDVAWEVTQQREKDVDEEVCAAARDEEDA